MVGAPRRAGDVEQLDQDLVQVVRVDVEALQVRDGRRDSLGRHGPHPASEVPATQLRPADAATRSSLLIAPPGSQCRGIDVVPGKSRSTNFSAVGCGSWLAR